MFDLFISIKPKATPMNLRLAKAMIRGTTYIMEVVEMTPAMTVKIINKIQVIVFCLVIARKLNK